MPAPCPLAPEYTTWTLHGIAFFSIPINVLGFYLVMYKSPGIAKYKYCVFYVQAATFITELIMTVISPAYFFFPILAGYDTTELLSAVISEHLLFAIWTFFLCSELPALMSCFIYRHNSSENMRTKQNSRITKKIMFSLSQIFPFAVFFGFYKSKISREEAYQYLSKNYPQCLFWLDSPALNIYDWKANSWIAITGIGALVAVVFIAGYGFSLAICTMLLLHELRSHMSSQTFRLHQNALIALSLQVIIPSVLIILPLFICFWVVITDNIDKQELAANSIGLIACHSVCSTMVMIFANSRYRQVIRSWVPWGKKDPKEVVSVGPTSMMTAT